MCEMILSQRSMLIILVLSLMMVWPAHAANRQAGLPVTPYEQQRTPPSPQDAAGQNLRLAGSLLGTPQSATKVYDKGKDFYEIWYDPTLWKRTVASRFHRDAEAVFRHSSLEALVLIISEDITRDMSELKPLVLNNAAKNRGRVLSFQDRMLTINGTEILNMFVFGKGRNGRPFVYYGYYWSGEAGTIQLVAFAFKEHYEKHKRDMVEFLNGLVIKR